MKIITLGQFLDELKKIIDKKWLCLFFWVHWHVDTISIRISENPEKFNNNIVDEINVYYNEEDLNDRFNEIKELLKDSNNLVNNSKLEEEKKEYKEYERLKIKFENS